MSLTITRIKAENFKGQTFEERLASAQIWVGDNYAGKSSRLDLVRWVLLGHLPELGKRNSDTFDLSSARDMRGEIELSDGRLLRRRLYLKGDSVKEEADVPDDIEGSSLIPVMLDSGEYFAMSERDRIAWVFANCEIGDLDLSPDSVRTKVLAARSSAAARVFDEASLEDVPENNQEWLELKIAAISASASNHRANLQRMEKTVQGLSQLRVMESPAESGPDIAELTDRFTKTSEQHVAIKSSLDEARRSDQRRSEIETTLRTIESDERRALSLKEDRDKLETELRNLPPCRSPAAIIEELTSAQAEQATTKREISAFQRKMDEIDEELSQLETKDKCPYCGARGEGWKELKRAALDSELSATRERLDIGAKSLSEVDPKIAALIAEKTSATENEARRKSIAAAMTTISREIEKVSAAAGRAQAMRDELHKMGERAADVERLTKEEQEFAARKRDLQIQLTERRRSIDAGVQRAADLKRLAQAESERDEAKELLATAKDLTESLRSIQADAVERAFAPMLARANRFAAPVLSSAIAYNRARNELGTWRDGVWVGHRTFSGTEKAVAYAAIQAALAARAPLRLMLVDELGRLRDRHAASLIGAVIASIKAGEIDQFLGCDTAERVSWRFAEYRNIQAADLAFNLKEIVSS